MSGYQTEGCGCLLERAGLELARTCPLQGPSPLASSWVQPGTVSGPAGSGLLGARDSPELVPPAALPLEVPAHIWLPAV